VADKNYILGLDVGNTVIKAVLFDTAGRQIAQHAIDGHSTFPQPGYVERDLEELWRNGCEAIRQLLVKSSPPFRQRVVHQARNFLDHSHSSAPFFHT